MSAAYRKRIESMRTLIAGSVIGAHPAEANLIDHELADASSTTSVPQLPRRRLLQILHTTRSLDSFLLCFLGHHTVPGNPKSIGQYLKALVDNGGHPTLLPLSAMTKNRYQTSITNPRNRFMHQAGAFPATEGEVMQILSEMQACIADILLL